MSRTVPYTRTVKRKRQDDTTMIKRPNLAPMSRLELRKYIRAVSLRQQETKFITYSSSVATPHNAFRFWNLVRNISQGAGQNERLGEMIHIQGIRIAISLSNFSLTAGAQKTALNKIKCFLVYSTEALTTTTASPFTSSDVQDSGSTPNSIIDRMKTDDLTVLKSWTLEIKPSVTDQNNDVELIAYHPIKKDYRFYGSEQAYGKDGTYYLLMTAWMPGGTTGTTTIQTNVYTTLYFKDG